MFINNSKIRFESKITNPKKAERFHPTLSYTRNKSAQGEIRTRTVSRHPLKVVRLPISPPGPVVTTRATKVEFLNDIPRCNCQKINTEKKCRLTSRHFSLFLFYLLFQVFV